MEIVIRTKKHYWHFDGWRLSRKVTSWDWSKIMETIDALHAVQAEELDLQLEELREFKVIPAIDETVDKGYLAAPGSAKHWRERTSQASGWRKQGDCSLPTKDEPWPHKR